ncbi:hypothetical protein ACJU26_05975 [Acidithiobacillus sp. M4-SHS-6]|uniref:hypothetical protein n=1 Tax=Acidithiobacillus sp. M4-SHS-6 TaxID=3383024 RepID=UPI0039BDCFCB
MINSNDRGKLENLVDNLADAGAISRDSAYRLLRQVFFQEDITDRYVRTEAGFVALGLTLCKQEPGVGAIVFRWAPVSGKPDHYRWVLSVREDVAPKILREWDRYVRVEYAANLVQCDETLMAEKRKDCERYRRRHWPFQVVVDNTGDGELSGGGDVNPDAGAEPDAGTDPDAGAETVSPKDRK